MLLVFNDCNFINLENVGHAMLSYKAIGFYLNSGESRYFGFDTDDEAKEAFDTIIKEYSYSDHVKVLKFKTNKEV